MSAEGPTEAGRHAAGVRHTGDAVRLPGVGTQLRVADAGGAAVTGVRRHDGSVQLYGEGRSTIELPPAAARALGSFMSGHFLASPELIERLDDVLGGLRLDWVTLEPGSAAAGRSIADLAVRRSTGVTIIAVLRGAVPIVAPDPDTVLATGDDLVVACRDHDLDRFRELLVRGR
jgi:TrkA domain protein